ncbi:MAG: hypothetical protein IT327_07740 [Anaerolineae bacterium]|nr:hypothetical protein [Anaerolineae bacterium]
MSEVIISGTAKGFGSSKFRYVSGLSSEAKTALKDNSALVICERPFNDKDGDWYVVTENRGRYGHRLPTDQERREIGRM